MAFAAVASKRAAPLAVAGILKKLLLAAPPASAASRAAPSSVAAAALRPVVPARGVVAAPARRLFSTVATPFRRDDFVFDSDTSSEEEYSSGGDDEDEYSGYDRLRARAFSFSMFDSAAAGVAVDRFGGPMCRGRLVALTEEKALRECWVSKEDADALKLKVAMPGLGKEHVKVWADQDALRIEGEGDKDAEHDDDDEDPASYSHRIQFPEDYFKMDQIKAEMKDGVLKVTVPKIKLEDRKDVIQVKVE